MSKTAKTLFLSILLLSSCAHVKRGLSTKLFIKSGLIYEEELSVEKFEALRKELKEQLLEQGSVAVDRIFMQGLDASHRGKHDLAVVYLEEAFGAKAQDLFLKKRLAFEYIKANQAQKAKTLFEEILKVEFDESIAIAAATIDYTNGDIERVRNKYRDILKRSHFKSEKACYLLAKTYLDHDEIKGAKSELRSCGKMFKKSALFDFFLAKLAVMEGKNKLAIRYLKKGLKKNPEHSASAQAKAQIYLQEGKIKEADSFLVRHLKKSPQDMGALGIYLNLLLSQKRFEESIPYAEKMVSLDQSNLNMKVKLGILYADLRQYDLASEVFEEVLEQSPDSERVLYYLGTVYAQGARYSEAISALEKIKDDSELFAEASLQVVRIMSLLAQGEATYENKMLNFFESLVSRYRDRTWLLGIAVAVSEFFEGKEDFGEAASALLKVSHLENFTPDHLYYLGMIYDKAKEFKKSEAIIAKVLERDPEHVHSLNFLAYSWIERSENLDLAYQYVTKALEKEPGDHHILDTLGWYYYKVGDYEKALKYIKKSWEGLTGDPVIAEHLGLVYKSMKTDKMANKYLRIAIDKSDDQEKKLFLENQLENILGNTPKRLPASGD